MAAAAAQCVFFCRQWQMSYSYVTCGTLSRALSRRGAGLQRTSVTNGSQQLWMRPQGVDVSTNKNNTPEFLPFIANSHFFKQCIHSITIEPYMDGLCAALVNIAIIIIILSTIKSPKISGLCPNFLASQTDAYSCKYSTKFWWSQQ